MVTTNRLCDGDMNSCIINYYSNGSARTRPHADDESYIVQSSSICSFSIGSSRDIGIFNRDEKLLQKYTLENGSLFIMRPGAQSNSKHQILSGKNCTGERYSISFRKIELRHVENEWPFHVPHGHNTQQNKSPAKDTTVILGTSIAHWLNYEKLAGKSGRYNVINLCGRGAKISNVEQNLDEFYTSTDTITSTVNRVIVSVGTNDLRNNKRDTVTHLYTPMENLITKIQTYFPSAKIHVQLLLPQRVVNGYTVTNVQGFNKMLIRLCANTHCTIIDIFNEFLGRNKHPNPSLYRWDGVHLSGEGLRILARAFISKIRGRFDPFNGV